MAEVEAQLQAKERLRLRTASCLFFLFPVFHAARAQQFHMNLSDVLQGTLPSSRS